MSGLLVNFELSFLLFALVMMTDLACHVWTGWRDLHLPVWVSGDLWVPRTGNDFRRQLVVRWPIRETVTLALHTNTTTLTSARPGWAMRNPHILSSSEREYLLDHRDSIIVAEETRQRDLIMTGSLYQTRPVTVDSGYHHHHLNLNPILTFLVLLN